MSCKTFLEEILPEMLAPYKGSFVVFDWLKMPALLDLELQDELPIATNYCFFFFFFHSVSTVRQNQTETISSHQRLRRFPL